LHYLVLYNDVVVGIISGASAVWACKPRDDFFDITKDNRIEKIGQIVNNVVFRLEITEKNLGTRVLKLWRNTVVKDWEEKYASSVLGFETFVFGPNRTGALYKADNWEYVGETAGSTKLHLHGCYNAQERITTEVKHIFCKALSMKGRRTTP